MWKIDINDNFNIWSNDEMKDVIGRDYFSINQSAISAKK